MKEEYKNSILEAINIAMRNKKEYPMIAEYQRGKIKGLALALRLAKELTEDEYIEICNKTME